MRNLESRTGVRLLNRTNRSVTLTDPTAMKEFLKDQPIGRMGTSEEIAASVLWLCSPASSFVLGVALAVNGGFTAH